MIALLKSHAAPLLSGLLLALAFPSVHLSFLVWVALIPLLWRVRDAGPFEAAAAFFAAGWLFHSVTLNWLMANVMWAGGAAFIGYQLLAVALSLFWAAAGLLWRWGGAHAPGAAGAFYFAFLWTAMEWCHAHLFTGFGWTALAYTQGPNLPLLQWASVGGVGLIAFFIALFNALAALVLFRPELRPVRALGAAAALTAPHLLGGLLIGDPEPDPEGFRAGLIQTNFPQEMKWDPAYTHEMVALAAEQSEIMALRDPVDLLVWPEATIMTDFEEPQVFERLVPLTQSANAALFAGSIRHADGKGYNSSVYLDAEGNAAGFYDKLHLAPFGEYIPFQEHFPFLANFVPGAAVDFGEEAKTFAIGRRHFGPLICFEVLFAPMAETLRAKNADFLVVITNLAWFGASSAVPQELEIARLRAIETRLPLVHCANTGISGVFDPWGRFEVIDGYISPGGRYFTWRERRLEPAETRGQRRVGALEVPRPAARIVPWSPSGVAWVFPAGAAAFVLAMLLGLGRRPAAPPPAPEFGDFEPEAAPPGAESAPGGPPAGEAEARHG